MVIIIFKHIILTLSLQFLLRAFKLVSGEDRPKQVLPWWEILADLISTQVILDHLIQSFYFFTFRCGNTLKVNIFVTRDHFRAHQKVAALTSDEVRHHPGLLLPFHHAAANEFSPLVSGSLLLSLGCFAFRLENNVKHIRQQLPCVFDIGV